MSGIAGVVRFDGATVEPGVVEGMTAAMAHRGPDGIRHWSDGSVALGHCMLHTTPESLDERQPLVSEDGNLVLVMDGRVDNWEELRAKLLAHDARLRTRADAELVLRAYERWGHDCLHHIDGDFALVVWDARRREAFCARDRTGTKALHYHFDGQVFAFATEVQALLALPWVPQELNESMVAQFLACAWCSHEETFWVGVHRLPPAHRMSVGARGRRADAYWTPDLSAEIRYKREEEYVEHYRALVFDIVRRLSRSHAPLACEVSGGLDSSAIFSAAEHLRRAGRLAAPGLEGYSLHFGDGSPADEAAYGRAVARHLGRGIHEIEPTRKPVEWYRAAAARWRDFPDRPNAIMHFGIYEAASAGGCRVILSGSGGDHWLGQSRAYYAELLRSGQLGELLRAAGADARDFGMAEALRLQIRWSVFAGLPLGAQQRLRRLRHGGKARENSLVALGLSPRLRRALAERGGAADPADGARAGQREVVSTLARAYDPISRQVLDRNASAHGLECRAPFFHPEIVQFALATSPRLRLRGKQNKFLHRNAFAELLPAVVQQRLSKAHFNALTWDGVGDAASLSALERSAKSYDWTESGEVERLVQAAARRDKLDSSLRAYWNLLACIALAESVNKPLVGSCRFKGD